MNQFIVKKNYLFSFKKYFNYFLNLIVIFYPFFIISGPAALEFASAIFLLVGLYYFFYNKLYLKFNIYLIFFLLFYISANFSSFLSNDQYSAFGRSLFLFRIPFIIFGILFILSKNQYVFKYTIYSILFCFIFIYFDDLLQFFTGFDIFNFPKINHRLSGPFNDELIPGKFLFRFGLISICIIFIIFKNYHFNFFLITSFFFVNWSYFNR